MSRQSRARTTAILSIIVSVTTILLAQLIIDLNHAFMPPNCPDPDRPSLTETDEGVHSHDIKCSGILDFGINSVDIIFVTITLFSIFADLPANVMLLVAIHSKVTWMFIPWLVVTDLKIIGCIVTVCFMMHIINDISHNHQHQYINATCIVKTVLKSKYAFRNL